MIPGMIKDATRVVGKSQGYYGLPIRDERVLDKATGQVTPCMVTVWEPTPAELEALNKGAPVQLRVLGNMHPPIIVGVGEVPET